jgi:hypothetical protein
MAENQYIKLTGNFYFDPVNRYILKKQGTAFIFVRHDRRNFHKPVGKDRRGKFDFIPIHLKPIAQGLLWDAESKNVYKVIRGNYVLYSRDRRKMPGNNPVGHERRQKGTE